MHDKGLYVLSRISKRTASVNFSVCSVYNCKAYLFYSARVPVNVKRICGIFCKYQTSIKKKDFVLMDNVFL